MTLQVLLSAMHLKDYHYISTLNISGNCVVVNQCGRESQQIIEDSNRTVKYIETKERGLSKSRNMALRNADADICILCDNDVEYQTNYESVILDAYRSHPDYDIIIFHVTSDDKPVPYYKTPRKLNHITCLKATSYEISFRKSKVEQLQFDEHIGAGTKFNHGEENAFLYACLRKKLKIFYMPVEIAKLRYEPSTWKTGFDKSFFISRGASYESMTKIGSLFLIFQFAVRKHKLYKQHMSFYSALKYMLLGRRQYKNEVAV